MANDYTKIALQLQGHKTVQGIMKYVNKESLIEQDRKQDKKKATGIDKVTKEQYEEQLGTNIDKLLERMKQFAYRPQAVRRTYIPKTGSKELRPLGIPAYEDKLVQGVMAEILNQIYEPIFLENSYGFRPKRDCHMAIKEVNRIIMTRRINYVVDADIKSFFDNVDHKWMIKFLEHVIQDKTFIRYIMRFLKSGIMEELKKYESDKGTPQGGLISPILANIYLHYVIDLWFEKEIKANCKGEAYMIRYADDFVSCFEKEKEAKEYYERLKERLAKFKLEISEEKSKIIKFGKNSGNSKDKFDFLGFTHQNGISRKGKYKLVEITSQKKLTAKKKAVKEWLKENIQLPTPELIKKLNIKLIGHYRYYGITNNSKRMYNYRNYIILELFKRLRRRSQKHKMTVERYKKILEYNSIATPKIYVPLW